MVQIMTMYIRRYHFPLLTLSQYYTSHHYTTVQRWKLPENNYNTSQFYITVQRMKIPENNLQYYTTAQRWKTPEQKYICL